jgi:hypothetical protein
MGLLQIKLDRRISAARKSLKVFFICKTGTQQLTENAR